MTRKYRLRIVATVLVMLAWGDSWVYLRAIYHDTPGQRFTVAQFAGRVSLYWDDLYGQSLDRPGTKFRADRVAELPFFNPKYPYGHRRTFWFPELPWPVSHVVPPFEWHNNRTALMFSQVRTKGVDIPYWLFLLGIWIKPILSRLRKRFQSATEDPSKPVSVPSVNSVVL